MDTERNPGAEYNSLPFDRIVVVGARIAFSSCQIANTELWSKISGTTPSPQNNTKTNDTRLPKSGW
jgi:hypothetical protein